MNHIFSEFTLETECSLKVVGGFEKQVQSWYLIASSGEMFMLSNFFRFNASNFFTTNTSYSQV